MSLLHSRQWRLARQVNHCRIELSPKNRTKCPILAIFRVNPFDSGPAVGVSSRQIDRESL